MHPGRPPHVRQDMDQDPLPNPAGHWGSGAHAPVHGPLVENHTLVDESQARFSEGLFPVVKKRS